MVPSLDLDNLDIFFFSSDNGSGYLHGGTRILHFGQMIENGIFTGMCGCVLKIQR